MRNLLLWAIIIVMSSLLLTGCGGAKQTPASGPVEVTVSAAISLKEPMEEIQRLYQGKNPSVIIRYNFGSSGSLKQQIEQGAPVDLFVSAALSPMDELEQKNLVRKATRRNLVENELVLIVPGDSVLGIQNYRDLADGRIKQIGIGTPETVPAGQYAKEVLTNLGLWDQVKGKIVMAKDARQVLTYVETGNVDAGIVYQTDALRSTGKIVTLAPPATHAPIVYPAAVLAGTRQPEAAEAFLAYLTGPEAQKVFMKYGFRTGK